MTQPDQVREIDVRRAAARAGAVLLLDVREDDEWAAGHAPDALHMPLSTMKAWQDAGLPMRSADGTALRVL